MLCLVGVIAGFAPPSSAALSRSCSGIRASAMGLHGCSRREATGLLLSAGAFGMLGSASPAVAFFESREQVAVSAVATAQPKISSMVAEVAEVARKRKKMASDLEDDAYVFRFARAVLDPASAKLQEAAPALAARMHTSSN